MSTLARREYRRAHCQIRLLLGVFGLRRFVDSNLRIDAVWRCALAASTARRPPYFLACSSGSKTLGPPSPSPPSEGGGGGGCVGGGVGGWYPGHCGGTACGFL